MASLRTGPTATAAGELTLGGDMTVRRLGYGAMRITGEGIWGEPEDRDGAIAVLRRPSSWTSTSSTPPTPTART